MRSHRGEQEGPTAGFLCLDTQQVCHLLAQNPWGGEGSGVALWKSKKPAWTWCVVACCRCQPAGY